MDDALIMQIVECMQYLLQNCLGFELQVLVFFAFYQIYYGTALAVLHYHVPRSLLLKYLVYLDDIGMVTQFKDFNLFSMLLNFVTLKYFNSSDLPRTLVLCFEDLSVSSCAYFLDYTILFLDFLLADIHKVPIADFNTRQCLQTPALAPEGAPAGKLDPLYALALHNSVIPEGRQLPGALPRDGDHLHQVVGGIEMGLQKLRAQLLPVGVVEVLPC